MAEPAVLCSVGTSLLARWKQQNPGRSVTEQELIHFLRASDPHEAAAETNSLLRIRQRKGAEFARLVLLVSQTDECRLCAQAIRNWAERKGWATELVPIEGLDYQQGRFVRLGLRGFVQEICRQVEKARRAGQEPILNATAGFKAETAFALLAGQMLGVEVYYIHEAFEEVICMPPMPVSLDVMFWRPYEDLLGWLFEEPRKRGEYERRNPPPEMDMLIEETQDDCVTLAPHGIIFYEAYLDRVEVWRRSLEARRRNVRQTQDESTLWHKAGHLKGVIESIDDIPDKQAVRLLERLLRNGAVEEILLADFHTPGRSYPPALRLRSVDKNGMVVYELETRCGKQAVRVIVKPGREAELIEDIGKYWQLPE